MTASALHTIDASLIPPSSVRRDTLPNGLTVLVRTDQSAPVVAIVTYVRAGYFDEPDDVVGIAHVLEHMFFKGTARRAVGAISQETKAAGGYLNAGTIYDHTSYYTVLPAAALERGLDIQGDAYAGSAIDAAELARELEVIIQEAKRKADHPAAVAVETLYELLHDQHRIRRWRIGREPALRALRRDQVVGFYRNYYRPRNTVLVVAGDVDADRALELVMRSEYARVPDATIARDAGPFEPDHRGFRYRELAGDIAQSQLVLGWRTPGTLHDDTPLLDLAGLALGGGRASRLYRAVRERTLAASINAHDYTPTELGVFTVHAEGPPEQTLSAARAIWAQMRELRAQGIEADELTRARSITEARWTRRLETMEGQATHLAEWESLGDWRLGDRYLARLLTADAAEVTDAVRRHLDPDRAGVLIYRPTAAPLVAADASTMRALLDGAPDAPLERSTPRTPSIATRPPPVALEREEGAVRVYRGAQGVPILVRRRPGAALVHLGAYLAGGAVEEDPALAGLTSLMARTALKGTERRSAAQIAEDGELLGGSVGAAAGAESFGWSISVPRPRLAPALELLADVATHPTFPATALDTERAIALADLALLRDDMYRYPLRLLVRRAFAGHAYGVPASGTEDTLPRIDDQRLHDWHRTRVLGGAAVIAIVGDVDADAVAALADHCFSALGMGSVARVSTPEWPSHPSASVEERDKAQTAIALAFPGPSRSADDRHAAHLIAGVASGLGGRFFEELRDRQSLAYSVSAFASERRAGGMFVSYIATSPEREGIARDGLLREFAKFRDAPVTADELHRAQQYAIGTHAISQQSGSTVLGDLLDAWMFGRGLTELDEHDARLLAVTPDAMREVAVRYFDESRLVEGIVRGKAAVAAG